METAESTDKSPIWYLLPIEVRMKGGKRRYEIWKSRVLQPLAKHCAEECDPMLLVTDVQVGGVVYEKSFSFKLESYNALEYTARYEMRSFARSEWFYENISNFGYVRDPRLSEEFAQEMAAKK